MSIHPVTWSLMGVLPTQRFSLAGLTKELQYQASRAAALSELAQVTGRSVIIMGDQNMPYKLLKRIMATCATSEIVTPR